ncbi:hypothetical protein ABN702_05960 [Bacillus haimaensis]|uniref:hypothetical protein n=1 Tax=Bacillus haimaensis TaxID=3160967 RepID=UPI003AA8D2B5
MKKINIIPKCRTPISTPFYNTKKECGDKMGIILVYLIIGVLISASIFAVADFRPWYLFAALCVAWLPLILIGMIISLFMDLEEISKRLNR